MLGFWKEFLTLATIHFLAVIAPGPDFAITIRQSIRFGRKAGIFTAIGIGAGISVHVIYTLLGVSALMYTTPWLLNIAKAVGSFYLFYLGIKFIGQANNSANQLTFDAPLEINSQNDRQSFLLGFLTNATNPKATIFFLAVFTSIVSISTPMYIQIVYGIWMCFINALWFILVSLLFTNIRVRQYFLKIGPWFERTMGLMLIVLSIRLILGVAVY